METVNRVVPVVLEIIKSAIDAHNKILVDLKYSASKHSLKLSELEAMVTMLTAGVPALTKKVEDLEGQMRQNNLRLFGLPEGTGEEKEGKKVLPPLLLVVLSLLFLPFLFVPSMYLLRWFICSSYTHAVSSFIPT